MEFKDQVVLVTGASRGLGKAFAQCLADAGATVAVNSTGRTEAGASTVAEIEKLGGRAFHVPGHVEEAEGLVETTLAEAGHLDAIVHNAGFIDDKSLRKMTTDQWDRVLGVHLGAAFALTRAAWPCFEARGAGRLVFVSSAAGLYGNFGQANYAAAKMGLYGLCRTIAIEGKKADIACNCVAPFGATEMNSAGLPDALKAAIKPDYIAPLVGYLAHPECRESGGLFEASAGAFKKLRWERSEGIRLAKDEPMTIGAIADRWEALVDFSTSEHPKDMNEALMGLYSAKKAGQRTES
jgi:3-hydroxyacyl-CoA dehydrogenase/3a,7a,12a-trihydroxy-5b-cholest-24-enoyl-CoA hydratase